MLIPAMFNIFFVVHFFFSITRSIPIFLFSVLFTIPYNFRGDNGKLIIIWQKYKINVFDMSCFLQSYATNFKIMINNYLNRPDHLTFINIVRKRALLYITGHRIEFFSCYIFLNICDFLLTL